MGRGAGSSTEFQDHRNYTPGDDLRKLDWRAFARTDQLMLKRYREEVRPTVEILVDASRSMASEPGKAQLAVDMAALITRSSLRVGWRARPWILDDTPRSVPLEALLHEGVDCGSRRPLMDTLGAMSSRTSAGAMVVLISDFLSPHEAESLVGNLARRAGAVGLLQVLGPWEAAPPVGGSFELVDAEGGERIQVNLDSDAVTQYSQRLGRLSDALAEQTRRAGGSFGRVVAQGSLERTCRSLGEQGWLLAG